MGVTKLNNDDTQACVWQYKETKIKAQRNTESFEKSKGIN